MRNTRYIAAIIVPLFLAVWVLQAQTVDDCYKVRDNIDANRLRLVAIERVKTWEPVFTFVATSTVGNRTCVTWPGDKLFELTEVLAGKDNPVTASPAQKAAAEVKLEELLAPRREREAVGKALADRKAAGESLTGSEQITLDEAIAEAYSNVSFTEGGQQ
jgi:hypothetical protein